MDPEQRKTELMDYFSRMGINTNCAICGSEDWEVVRVGDQYETENGHKVMPVDLLCHFCGRIVTYNAFTIHNK